METKQLTRMETKTCFIFPIKKQNAFADTKHIIKFYDAANKTRTLTTETIGQGGPRGLKPDEEQLPS